MKIKLNKANERGKADHGWLKANFSFSFAHYFNPSNMNFGALRVLNDDHIQGGMGFGRHPHDNMEIITIPLKGTMKHKDSMSEKWIPLQTGEVQVMSAGRGIQHSEMNNHPSETVNLFQLWIVPNKQQVAPRYKQKAFNPLKRKNKLQTLVSFIDNKVEGSLGIHQDAKISRIDLEKDTDFVYNLEMETNGVYLMLIEGEINVEEYILQKRDAIGIEQTQSFKLNVVKDSELLFIEVPMKF